jgi:hypothetical protein
MKSLILACVILASANSFADIAVTNGKVFDLKPGYQPECGDAGSPAIVASKMLIGFALSNGKSTAAALCAGGATDYCTKDSQAKFALDLLFTAARNYPSQYRSAGCKELRSECNSLCTAENILSKDDCLIGCNQYDSWNK